MAIAGEAIAKNDNAQPLGISRSGGGTALGSRFIEWARLPAVSKDHNRVAHILGAIAPRPGAFDAHKPAMLSD